MRRPAAARQRRPLRVKSFPAPTRGWIANRNLAEPEKNGAFALINMFPETETVRLRGGKQKYATIGDGGGPVTSFLTYKFGNAEKIWATTASGIYDITSVGDASVSPTADVDSLSGGDWVGVQIQTPGGAFLRAVNGADPSQLYDGSAWSNSQKIYDTEDLSETDISSSFVFGWTYKKRLFFIQNNLNAYYLPVETISGSATKLPLGGVFKRGGSLLFGATWSQDTGEGIQTICVFVTTEGEAAAFSGNNPGDANDWTHLGTYRIGKPLGRNAWFQAGGDIAIATDTGLISLAQARTTAVEALGATAASHRIASAWEDRVRNRTFAPWQVEIWPRKRMVLVAMPSSNDYAPEMLVANTERGGWCQFTNWDAKCIEVFGSRAFIGSGEGKIFALEETGFDDGTPYVGTCLLHFDSMNQPAADKLAMNCRAVFRARENPQGKVFVKERFDEELPLAPDSPVIESFGTWDDEDTKWDEFEWGNDSVNLEYFDDWQSVSGQGDVLAPGVRITYGSLVPPRTYLVRFDLTYDLLEPVA